MKCSFCSANLVTAETRRLTRPLPPEWEWSSGPRGNAQVIFRRRRCPACESKFSTVEFEVVPGAKELFEGKEVDFLPRAAPLRRKGRGDGSL